MTFSECKKSDVYRYSFQLFTTVFEHISDRHRLVDMYLPEDIY